MKIREATRDDSKWILRHRIEMFRDMGELKDSLDATTKLTEEYLETDWTKDYLYFLVEDNDRVVGGCGISLFRIPPQLSQPTGVYAYLSNMFIEPEFRRKGFGKKLVEHVIKHCQKARIGLLLLHASDMGLSLYRDLGFLRSPKLLHMRTEDYHP